MRLTNFYLYELKDEEGDKITEELFNISQRR